MTKKTSRQTHSRRKAPASRASKRKPSTPRQRPPKLELKRLVEWLRRSFGPRQKEMLALLLMVGAIVTLLGLMGITSGSIVDSWSHFLRQAVGLGAYPLTVALAGLGAWLLLRAVNQVSTLTWRLVVGLQVTFLAALAFFHWLAAGDAALVAAQNGQGGGYVGWAIADLLRRTLGDLIAVLLLLLGLLAGLALTFDWTVDDLTGLLWRLMDRLRRALPQAAPPPREAQSQSTVKAHRRTPAPTTKAAPAHLPTAPQPTAHQPELLPTELEPRLIGDETPPKPRPQRRAVRLPSLDLLISDEEGTYGDADLRFRQQIIEDTLRSFDAPCKVVGYNVGPVVTQFELEPLYTESGGVKRKVRVSKISALANDLSLALAASPIRIEAPVPGRSVVGVEVPNSEVAVVGLRGVMASKAYQEKRSRLKIALGRSVSGEPVMADLATMPHLLIAGATGSGKSVCINTITTCLAFNNRPEDLQLAMIDPKMVELTRFNGLPHLIGPVEVELERIGGVLYWATTEMDVRYKKFAAVGARNLDDYNKKVAAEERLPRIVILIDELADMMLSAPDETERTITRLAQMARATGMHLVVATQRPSVDVVTGLIKANFPARVSFAVTSQVDSRVILDQPGAETLLGRGDMLYMSPDAAKLVRLQGCFVSDAEITNLLNFWNEQLPPQERDQIPPWDETIATSEYDPLMEEAIELVRQSGAASASFLQRRMRIGYPRASRIIDQMEEMGIIGPQRAGGRRRQVLLEAEGEPPPQVADEMGDE
ncbi:MAG: DNA translocase FtsK [Chloroflexota bacterium]